MLVEHFSAIKDLNDFHIRSDVASETGHLGGWSPGGRLQWRKIETQTFSAYKVEARMDGSQSSVGIQLVEFSCRFCFAFL